MERLKSIVYKFAILIAVISLVTNILSGVSLVTGLLRSGVVFLLTLVAVVVALTVIRKVLMHPSPPSTDIEQSEE